MRVNCNPVPYQLTFESLHLLPEAGAEAEILHQFRVLGSIVHGQVLNETERYLRALLLADVGGTPKGTQRNSPIYSMPISGLVQIIKPLVDIAGISVG